MNTKWNAKTISGWVIHGLIAALLLFAGAAILSGQMPPEEVEKTGLGWKMQMIGVGELACAILLLVPRTASLGVLMTSALWGGTISFHMARGEPYVFQSVLLLLTWLGGYLRVPGTFASFSPRPAVTEAPKPFAT